MDLRLRVFWNFSFTQVIVPYPGGMHNTGGAGLLQIKGFHDIILLFRVSGTGILDCVTERIDCISWAYGFALILCIALSAFFSATETAFSASNRVKLKTVDGPRKGKAQPALGLLEKYDSLLTTVLIGNNVVNIAGTAIATVLFANYLMKGSAEGAAATVASAVMTVLVLFLGEVGPKTLAKQQPEKFAMAVSPVIRVLMVAAAAAGSALFPVAEAAGEADQAHAGRDPDRRGTDDHDR